MERLPLDLHESKFVPNSAHCVLFCYCLLDTKDDYIKFCLNSSPQLSDCKGLPCSRDTWLALGGFSRQTSRITSKFLKSRPLIDITESLLRLLNEKAFSLRWKFWPCWNQWQYFCCVGWSLGWLIHILTASLLILQGKKKKLQGKIKFAFPGDSCLL